MQVRTELTLQEYVGSLRSITCDIKDQKCRTKYLTALDNIETTVLNIYPYYSQEDTGKAYVFEEYICKYWKTHLDDNETSNMSLFTERFG